MYCLGLSRDIFQSNNLPPELIHKVYSGLYVYSLGLMDRIIPMIKHSPHAVLLLAKIWQAYLHLLQTTEVCNPSRYPQRKNPIQNPP